MKPLTWMGILIVATFPVFAADEGTSTLSEAAALPECIASVIATNDALKKPYEWFFTQEEITNIEPKSIKELDRLLSAYRKYILDQIRRDLETSWSSKLVCKESRNDSYLEFETVEDFIYPTMGPPSDSPAHGPGSLRIWIRPIERLKGGQPSIYNRSRYLRIWELHTEIKLSTFTKECRFLPHFAQRIVEQNVKEMVDLAEFINKERLKASYREELHRRGLGQSTEALSYFHDEIALPELLDLVRQRENKSAPISVIQFFGQMKYKESVPFLLEMLDQYDCTHSVAYNIMDALGNISDERAIPKLIEISRNPRAEAKVPALWALLNFDDPRAVQEVLKNETEYRRHILKGAIQTSPLPFAYVPMLRNILEADHPTEPNFREYALWALANTGTEEARKILMTNAQNGKSDAIHHLGAFPSSQTAEYLISILREDSGSDDTRPRCNAAQYALTQMPEPAVPYLLEILSTESGPLFLSARNTMCSIYEHWHQQPLRPAQNTFNFSSLRQNPDTEYHPNGMQSPLKIGSEKERQRIAEAWINWWNSEQTKSQAKD